LPNYRLYRLDGAGKITTAEWIEANADEEALRQAHAVVDGKAFELWERQRLIAAKKAGG
jgi:hypothetical protein